MELAPSDKQEIRIRSLQLMVLFLLGRDYAQHQQPLAPLYDTYFRDALEAVTRQEGSAGEAIQQQMAREMDWLLSTSQKLGERMPPR